MRKIAEILALIIYKIVYDCIFISITSKVYAYGNIVLTYNAERYLVSWLLVVLFIFLAVYWLKNDLLGFAFKILMIIVAVPTLSLYGLKNMQPVAFIWVFIFWMLVLLAFIFFQMLKIGPEKKALIKGMDEDSAPISPNVSCRVCNIILPIAAVFVVIVSFLYSDFRILVSFDDAYTYRMAMREMQLPAIVRYGIGLCAHVFIPYCCCKYLLAKKYVWVAMCLLLSILLFSIAGNKMYILIYVYVFLVFIFVRFSYGLDKIFTIITLLIAIVGIIATIIYFGFNELTPVALYHRAFYVPADISYNYYDFFSNPNNPPLLLRESFMRYFADTPYNMQSSFIIGGQYGTGNYASNANNGLFGDAFANFKEIGVLLYPFLYAFIFKIMTTYSVKFDKRITIVMLLIVITLAQNASFFTWLITGGVIAWLLLELLEYKMMQKNAYV